MIIVYEKLFVDLVLDSGEVDYGPSKIIIKEARGFVRKSERYVAVYYRFTDWFEMGVSYGYAYPDEDNKDGKKKSRPEVLYDGKPFEIPPAQEIEYSIRAWQRDTGLFFRFDINYNWLLKIQLNYYDGAAYVLPSNNLNDAGVPELEQYWYMLAVKLTYSF